MMERGGKGAGYKLYEALSTFDMFGQTPSLKVDGKDGFRSILGALATIAVWVVTVSYAARQFNAMQLYEETTHIQVTESLANAQKVFQQSYTNMDIALGLARNDSWDVSEVDTTGYVDIVFLKQNWDTVRENGQQKVEIETELLKTHSCSSEEGR